MNLLPTDDQRAMSAAVRDTLVKECDAEALRASWGATQPRRMWQALADLGLFAVSISEDHGGLGLDERDAVGALEETGRAAMPGPVAESFAATYALQNAHAELADLWLPRLASGGSIATIGLERFTSADLADLLILRDGHDLFAVEPDQTEMALQPSMDGNRRIFSVKWDPSTATRLESTETDGIYSGVRDRLLMGVSAQLVGLGRRMLDFSVEHVKGREQFGKPLGSMQAVQHQLADVAVAVEFAGPVVARAACSLAAGSPSAARDTAMAKVFASDAAERAAYSSLQVHGAIGYTREHDLHLYSLRAWALAAAHGDARHHRGRVADELCGPSPAAVYP